MRTPLFVRRMAVTVKHNPNGKWGFARPEKELGTPPPPRNQLQNYLSAVATNLIHRRPPIQIVLRVFNPLSDGNTRSTSFASKKMSKVNLESVLH
jgi:hypothetical protein